MNLTNFLIYFSNLKNVVAGAFWKPTLKQQMPASKLWEQTNHEEKTKHFL